jgi:predicted nucleic-acid-binding protein
MRAVDTNVLVRLVTRDDRKQVAAAEAFVSKGAWVSTLVLVEATWVLTAVYELTHAEMATAIDMLLHHRDLTSKSPIVSPRHSSNIVAARCWGSPIV